MNTSITRRAQAAPNRTDAPRSYDAVPERLCGRCGIAGEGEHSDASECIDALRSTIAELTGRGIRRKG